MTPPDVPEPDVSEPDLPPTPERTARGLDARVVVEREGFTLDAALAVGAGEVLAVLGPNGAGKSTLLRALAGLLALTGGRIAVAGQVWDDVTTGVFVPVVQRSVGLVFQDYRLFPHLSVLDNVAFAARADGLGRRASREDAAGVITRLGLADLQDRRPRGLSGGQAQRVALARALASRPRMLLLDEPLAALDARTRLEIRTELRRHLSAFDGPSVVVTHDPLEALVLADRVLVLEGGRVVQKGTPSEVARRPATEYVARLMGLNLYAGVMRDGGVVDLLDGGTLTAAGSDVGAPRPVSGEAVLVVLPPAAVTLHRHAPEGSARNVWTATVTGVELLTDRVRVALTGTPSALVDVTPAAVTDLSLADGQEVWLSAKATEVVAYADPARATVQR